MDKAPAFQFYPGDWFDYKVLRMPYEAQGMYFRIMCHMWKDSKDQCSIGKNLTELARVLGVSEDRAGAAIDEMQLHPDPIFKEKGDRYISKRLQRVRREQVKRRRQQSRAGKASGIARQQALNTRSTGGSTESKSSLSSSSSPSSSPEPIPTEVGGVVESGDARKKAVQEARASVEVCKSQACRTKLLEFLGYLENEATIPGHRIRQIIRKTATLRETFTMDNGVPVDRLFCYAIDETMKRKAAQPAYVGKVMQNAVMRYRDGSLKL